MMRFQWLLMCALLLSLTAGCEALIPLVIAAAEDPGDPPTDESWSDPTTYDPMVYEGVELDVSLDEVSGRMGDRSLDTMALHATGMLYGTSTQLKVSAVRPIEPEDVLEIWVDLCPIEDVIVNGDATTALVALYACDSDTCVDGTYEMRVSVVDEQADERTITIDTILEDGSPMHLRLRYVTPAL